MKQRVPKSFMTSMFLVIIGFTFLPMLALSFYSTVSIKSFASDLSAYELTETAKLLSSTLVDEVEKGGDAISILNRYSQNTKFRLTLIARGGTVLFDSHGTVGLMENHIARPEIRAAFESGIGTDYRVSTTTGMESTYAAIKLNLKNANPEQAIPSEQAMELVLRVSLPLPLVDARFKQQSNKLYLAMVWILFAGMVAAWFFSRRLQKPLQVLEQAAGQWANGNFEAHAKVKSPLEMARLSDSMNTMADQLQLRLTALSEKKHELKAILEAMGEALLVSNQHGMVEMWNPEAEVLLSGLQGGLINQNGEVQIPSGKSVLELSKSSDLASLEIKCRHGSREEQVVTIYGTKLRTLQVNGAPLPNKRGAVLVLSDITRMVQLETIRKDFVANVSHELKTPIQSIKGFTESLQGEVGADPEARERFLGIIQRNTLRMEAIIADLLVLARLEHVEAESSFSTSPVEIAKVVTMATSMLLPNAEKEQTPIVLEGDPDLHVLGNAGLLEQAILNLVDNAIRYSPQGSPVTIRWTADKGMAEISVIDQGQGIPLKDQDRLFERFYRVEKSRTREANAGGTGLGLAIVRHIAQLHGGSAHVDSIQGKGSTFKLLLPLAPNPKITNL